MANTPTVYAICDANCKFESMTKEQIIAAIAEATGVTVTNVDEAFITMLKEQNNGEAIRFWVGTQAQYNTLVENGFVEDGVIYLTEDGSKLAKIESAVNANAVKIFEHGNRLDTYGVELVEHEKKLNNHEDRIVTVERASGTLAGVLSITKGGTGATNAQDAMSNLGFYTRKVYITLNDGLRNGNYSGAADVNLSRVIPNSNYTIRAFATVRNDAHNCVTLTVNDKDYVGDLRIIASAEMSSTETSFTIEVDVLMIVVKDV